MTYGRVAAYRGRRYVNTGPSRETVELVLERDGHACIRCGVATSGVRGLHWSIQHRKPRSQGGTNDVWNLLAVCGSGTTQCHGHMESYRTEAYDLGWLVHRDVDPRSKAVLVAQQSRWTYLTATGYSDNPPEVAE